MKYRIKELRKKKGLSQDALAKKVGVSQQAISKYETGAYEPSDETLELLAELFGVSFDYLVGRSDEEKMVHLDIKLNDESESMFMENIRSLDDYSRSLIYAIAQNLIDKHGKKPKRPVVPLAKK